MPTLAVIFAAAPPPSLKSNVGVLVYPLPGLSIVRAVIIPLVADAVTIASLPPPPITSFVEDLSHKTERQKVFDIRSSSKVSFI